MQTKEKKLRNAQGGYREGSGRPKISDTTISVRVTEKQKQKYLALGGADWIRKFLEKD